MRSLIIIEVQHGETTDPLDAIVTDVRSHIVSGEYDQHGLVVFKNYSVRVDLPACFSLEDGLIPSDRT